MDMHVPQAGGQELASAIHNDEIALPACGGARADGSNATVADNDITPCHHLAAPHIDRGDIPDHEITTDAGTRRFGQRRVNQYRQYNRKRDGQPCDYLQ